MSQAMAARTVTAEEAAAFEGSVDGLAWKLWQCLEENHPEIDGIEAAKALLIEAGEAHFEQLARSVEIGSGVEDQKKYSGQAGEATEGTDLVGQSSTNS